ncbi:MAG: hypothetical protein ACJAS4_002859 [Bacteriovoracaceae bacterium]|jgi:conjugal transfer pilus assembly protein TraD
MSKSKKQESFDAGMFVMPFVELLNVLVEQGLKLLVKGGEYLFYRLISGGKQTKKVCKVERNLLSKKKTTTLFNSIGYSVTQKRNLKGSEINKTKHSVIVGSSGSGKSVLIDTLMFDDMRNGKPVIFLDPKGDNESMERFISLCKLNRREFSIFSENYKGDEAISLNPVLEGTTTHIADRLFNSFEWSEEYYANKSYQALQKGISLLKKRGMTVTLDSIYRVIFESCRLGKTDKDFIDEKLVDGLMIKLSKIIYSDFSSSLSGENTKSFRQLRDEGKCVYIGLPVLGYPEIARALGKLILGDVNYCVYDDYRTSSTSNNKSLTPVALYIDELSAFITNEFIETLNKCRGAKLEITTAMQTSSDLIKHDTEMCKQVFENSLNWYIMKQRMDDGAKFLSFAIGTEEGNKKTVRIEGGEEQDQGSQRTVEELLVHPNIIKNLDVGQCILLRQQPTKLDLLNVKYIDQMTIDYNIEFHKKVYGGIVQNKKTVNKSTGVLGL